MLKHCRRVLPVLALFSVLGWLAWPSIASAHAMYQTAVLLDFDGNRVGAELQLPVDRLSISFKQTVDQDHANDIALINRLADCLTPDLAC